MHDQAEDWPELPLDEWIDTYQTLHMWSQIVGKIRLGLAPLQNHWWNVALYVNARGLTTSAIPYDDKSFEIQFDFLDHLLQIKASSGEERAVRLAPKSVAAFYRETLATLRAAGIDVKINPKPQEVANPILFDQDETHASYDPEYASRLWRILLSTERVFQEFRAKFLGKCSPVHFFWGSFDLCCTRFSGRKAPARKGIITSEAYSHECSSLGWWPGGGDVRSPMFYAYMAPEPEGYGSTVASAPGTYSAQMHECFLSYDDVRRSPSPRQEILQFAQETYESGADLAKWDRATLERNWKGNSMAENCTHLDQIKVRSTHTHACEECVKTGDRWVHLRLCLICGHVGCCDSSKNKHATKHFRATTHPLIRSAERGENWVWCYVDQVYPTEL